MEKTTTVVSDKVEGTTERSVSKTTVMRTFNQLVLRLAKTDLLDNKELEELVKIKNKAMNKFLKTF